MYIRVQKNNKWGYFDPETNKSLECKYLRAYNFEDGYAIVQDESYESGVIDIDGKTTIPFKYNRIERGNDGCFRVYVHDLSCLINLEGTLLGAERNAYPLDLQVYDVVQKLSNNRYIVAKEGNLGLYSNGAEIIQCKYYSISHLDSDFFIVKERDDGYCGLLNSSGEIIIPLKYNDIGRQNGKLLYGERYGWDFYSCNGELKCQIYNRYGRIKAIQPVEGDTVLIDYCDCPYKADLWEGTVILTSADSEVRLKLDYDFYHNFHHGICEVGKENHLGLIDSEGNELAPCEYTSIDYTDHYALLTCFDSRRSSSVFKKISIQLFSLSEKRILSTKKYTSVSQYEDGYALVCNEYGGYGIINSEGVETLPCSFSTIEETDDPSIVRACSYSKCEYYKKSGEHMYKNSTGQFVTLPLGIKDCNDFCEGLALVRNNDYLAGFMNDEGEIVIPFKFGRGGVSVSGFCGGSARISRIITVNYRSQETGDYSFIDRHGNFIVSYNEKPIIIDGNDLQFVFPFEGNVARAIDIFGNWGLISPDGKQVTRFEYTRIDSFHNHEAIVVADKKMGVINDSGISIIPVKFSDLKRTKDGYTAKEGALDNDGNFVINGVTLDSTSFDECSVYEDQFILVKKNGLRGLVDLTGQVLLPCKYTSIGNLENGYVFCKSGSLSLLVSPSGDIIELPTDALIAKYYPNGIIQILGTDKKTSIITRRGGLLLKDVDFDIVDIRYNLIIYSKWVNYDIRQGVLDIVGNEVVSCEFKSLRFDGIQDSFIESNEVFAQRYDSHGNRVSALGSSLIPLNPRFTACCDFHEGLAAVAIEKADHSNRKSLLWGYINSNGDEVINCHFIQASGFSCGLAKVSNGELFGFIDDTGLIKIPYKFREATDFIDDYAVTKERSYCSLAVINTNGDYSIAPNDYEYLDTFQDGLALAKDKHHLFGFLGEDGKTAIPFVFKSAKPFHNGESFVVFPDNCSNEYRIDKQGRIIVSHEGRDRAIVVDLEEFSGISRFYGDRALLYDRYGHTGVISINGDVLIEPQHFENLNLASDGRFYVALGMKKLYVTSDGEGLIGEDGVLMDLDYQYEIRSYLTENLYEVQDTNNRMCRGVSDNTGSIVIPCIYTTIEVLSDKKHLLCTKENSRDFEYRDDDDHEWEYRHVFNLTGEQVILDKNYREVCKCQYSSYEWVDRNHCVIEIDGGYVKALINTEGDYILTPGKYKDIGRIEDGFAVVTMYPFSHKEYRQCEDPDNGGTYSYEERVYDERFINKDGCLVTGLEGEYLTFDKEYKWYIENSDETISVYDGKHWGLLDKELNLLVNCIYQEQFKFNGSYAVVKSEKGAGLIDKSGRLVIKYQYDRIECYPKYGIAYGWKETLVTVHNIKGEKLIEFDCDEVYPLSNKYTRFRRLKNRDWKSSGSLAGFISHETGKECFGFNDIGVEGDGLISIQQGEATTRSSKTWGFANYDGEVVIPCEYLVVRGFVNGQALVTDRFAGKYHNTYLWGTIKPDGSVSIPIIYCNLLYVKDTDYSILHGSYKGISTYLNAEGEPIANTGGGEIISFPGYYASLDEPVNGRILVYGENGIGVVDTQAKVLVECRDFGTTVLGPTLSNNGDLEIQLKNDSNTVLSKTMDSNGHLVTDKDGQFIVLPFKYIFAKEWVGNFIPVMVGNCWGVIDCSFNEVVSCSYHDIFIANNKAIAKSDTCFHIIDLNTKDTTDLFYDQVSLFTDNLLLVGKKTAKCSSSRDLFGFEPEKTSYKYGLVNLNGQVLLDVTYNEITVLNPEPEPDEDEDDSEDEDYSRSSYYDEDRPS